MPWTPLTENTFSVSSASATQLVVSGAGATNERLLHWSHQGGSFTPWLGHIIELRMPPAVNYDEFVDWYSGRSQGHYWQFITASINSYKGNSGRLSGNGYYTRMPMRTRRGRLSPLQFGGRTI